MNKKEIAEIRRRLSPEKNNLGCIRGLYLNEKKEILADFSHDPISLPQEELEKYLSLFKRLLSGAQGKNLREIGFSADQVMDGEEHRGLMALREAGEEDEENILALFRRIIDGVDMEGNYLILLTRDSYDLPYRAKDGQGGFGDSEEVFHYFLCAVCPVKPGKSALSYCAKEKDFIVRDPDFAVAGPELGFMFPLFDERGANIHGALYYAREAESAREDFVKAVFGVEAPRPASEQKEAFDQMLEESLGEELSLTVVQTVHEQLSDMLREQKSDREAAPLTVSKREMRVMLDACGVPEGRAAAFEEKFDETFGKGADLNAENLVDMKQFELRTPNVTIRVDPERSDLVETRVIDGAKYILVRADEGVEVNGVDISIADGAR